MSCRISATHETLRVRARMLARIRAFFAERDVLEVETPVLSRAAVTDPAIESIAARVGSLGAVPHYLHTSPEYAMKRLLVAGAGDIYQICRVYRDHELGRWHQPEFTLLEWYRRGWDDVELMNEVERLLVLLLGDRGLAQRTTRLSYADAFRARLQIDPHGDLAGLAQALRQQGIEPPADLDERELLDLAFSTVVAPGFEPAMLTFVYDFPVSHAALARIKRQAPPVAARFEAFCSGVELANGFAELTDAAEQRQRFEAELEQRRRRGRHAPPLDEELLTALEQGLPPCAGVALGVDRIVALAAGLGGVAEAMSFAHGSSEGGAD